MGIMLIVGVWCYAPKIRVHKFILMSGFYRSGLTFSLLTCSRKFSRGYEDRSEPSPSRRGASETEFGSGICALSSVLIARGNYLCFGLGLLFSCVWAFTVGNSKNPNGFYPTLSAATRQKPFRKKKKEKNRRGDRSALSRNVLSDPIRSIEFTGLTHTLTAPEPPTAVPPVDGKVDRSRSQLRRSDHSPPALISHDVNRRSTRRPP